MLVFGKVCDFGCLEAAVHDWRQRVVTRRWATVPAAKGSDRLITFRSNEHNVRHKTDVHGAR